MDGPVTLADEFLALETELAATFGQSITLETRTATGYAANGTVTQTVTSTTWTADGPVSDVSRYAAAGIDQSITGTFYLPAQGLAVVPDKGDRIIVGPDSANPYQIIEVEEYQVQGVTTAYRCDCGKVIA
jgi:hypothetical protein